MVKQWLIDAKRYLALKITRGVPVAWKYLCFAPIAVLSAVVWLPVVCWKMQKIIADNLLKWFTND